MRILFGLALMITFAGCGALSSSFSSENSAAPETIPAARELLPHTESSETALRWLEARVSKDPDDFIALNKLGGYYLQKLRETGNLQWLMLADKTAVASLKAMPAEQNYGGVALAAQTAFASHNFAETRNKAEQLLQLHPAQLADRSFPYQLLGDAQLELGNYAEAEKAYLKMKGLNAGTVAVESRLAHFTWLHGKSDTAERHYLTALNAAVQIVPPSRETVAWLRWQLGELAFSKGEYEKAEKHFQDSLTTFPDYFRALASMGRVRAARGDLNSGIEFYQKAVRIIPDPTFVATLGDLYKLSGNEKEAAAQYLLVEQTGKLAAANGELYQRPLALFFADHDLKKDEAYSLAQKEYEVRRDVYGADTLAWAALKAGRIVEAQSAMRDALQLGTNDAKLFYHAGMIAKAAGDAATARQYLERALKLNPQFDPLQATIARKALAE